MLTSSFLRYIENQLGNKFGKKLHVKRVTPVSGGSINLSAKIDTTGGVFFLKTNDTFRYPKMFEKEAAGLDFLRGTKTLAIPGIVLTGEDDGQAFLMLEFIEARTRRSDFWEMFGRGLAELHRNTNFRFGFSESNFIGSLVQANTEHGSWEDFFIEERLEKQLKLARSSGKMNESDTTLIRKLYSRLDSLIPVERPALLHGDLWSGNFLTNSEGNAVLIDPAIYFGHREMDLAMTKLFGGFEEGFYNSYNEIYPLSQGFEDRIDIHNLYPLMVHVNLFGGGYVGDVRRILKKLQ